MIHFKSIFITSDWQRQGPWLRPLLLELVLQGRVCGGRGRQQTVHSPHKGGSKAGCYRRADVMGVVLRCQTRLQLCGE